MYLSNLHTEENRTFSDAWQKQAPWIDKVTFLTQFIKREYDESSGIRIEKCYFKVYEKDMTLCLCALAREREKGEIFSPQLGEMDWRKEPELGTWWWITLRNAHPGFIWYSAVGD